MIGPGIDLQMARFRMSATPPAATDVNGDVAGNRNPVSFGANVHSRSLSNQRSSRRTDLERSANIANLEFCAGQIAGFEIWVNAAFIDDRQLVGKSAYGYWAADRTQLRVPPRAIVHHAQSVIARIKELVARTSCPWSESEVEATIVRARERIIGTSSGDLS